MRIPVPAEMPDTGAFLRSIQHFFLAISSWFGSYGQD